MGQYIIFNNGDYKGVKDYLYQKGTKYKIKSSDTKYLYSMSDKIKKDDLSKMNEDEYKIDDIKE